MKTRETSNYANVLSPSPSNPGEGGLRARSSWAALSIEHADDEPLTQPLPCVQGRGARLRHRGLSIGELLISLAISAMLLTAVAAAYSASASAIEINDQFFRASQAARVSVNQIMAQVRKCQTVTINPTSLVMTTATGEDRTYAFDSASNTLTLTLTNQLVPPTYKLAHNVSNVSFTTDGKSVSMSITVQVGNNKVLLTGCAAPRRTITYQ